MPEALSGFRNHLSIDPFVDIDNQSITSRFLARIERSDGSEVSMRNCNLFVLQVDLSGAVLLPPFFSVALIIA